MNRLVDSLHCEDTGFRPYVGFSGSSDFGFVVSLMGEDVLGRLLMEWVSLYGEWLKV